MENDHDSMYQYNHTGLEYFFLRSPNPSIIIISCKTRGKSDIWHSRLCSAHRMGWCCAGLAVFYVYFIQMIMMSLCYCWHKWWKSLGWWGWVEKEKMMCLYFCYQASLPSCVPFYKGINVSSISQPFCFNTQHDLLFSLGKKEKWNVKRVGFSWVVFLEENSSSGLIECAHREAL